VLKLIKIIDFGVAISFDPAYSTDLFEGKTVGTLNFMAPEQLVGKESYQSDLYSLGTIIYSLLTGRVPLSLEGASNLKEKLRLVYRGSRIPIVEANPDLRASPELIEMASIVEPMLEPSPQSRPHIDEVKEKLEALWSTIDNTEKLLIPIKYAKPWGKMGPDFWERTTTNTLTLDELIN
jgi:serine/threonine protein kinase